MARLLRTSRAERDITAIVTTIGRDNLTAAFHWIEELEKLFRLIAAFPEMSEQVEARRLGKVRRTSFGNYAIYHRVRSETVRIIRVIHGARDHDKLV